MSDKLQEALKLKNTTDFKYCLSVLNLVNSEVFDKWLH